MKIKIVIFLCCINSFVYSQNKKALKYFNQAQQEINNNKFQKAQNLFLKSIEFSPSFIDAYLALKDVYAKLNKYDKAEEVLLIGYKNCNENQLFSLKLSELYYETGKYLNAINFCRQYLGKPNSDKGKLLCEDIMKKSRFSLQNMQKPVLTEIINLDKHINTIWDEYFPSVSLDEKKIVFTRKHNNQEDLFISNKTLSFWSYAKSHVLSTKSSNEGGVSFTLDSTEVYFAACGWSDESILNRMNDNLGGDCNLYYSYYIPGKWTDKEINITYNGRWSVPERVELLNSSFWDSQPSISWDGNTLYFVSNRKGGKGGKDIWMSIKDKNGNWKKPINLHQINTDKDEITPFIHYDNESLFYSSNGHLGFGKQDVFVSRIIDNNFSTAYNLGYPVNDYFNQSSLIVSFSGNKAYYSSDNLNGFGSLDIYEFQIPESYNFPKKMVLVKGIVKNDNNSPLDKVDVTFKTLQGKDINIKSKEDGSFKLCLQLNNNYLINIEKEGYIFYSDNLFFDNSSTFYLNVIMSPLEVKESTILKNVFFDFDSDVLNKNSFWELDNLVNLMNSNKNINIQIQGHTDNIGEEDYNYTLSLKRANSVKKYLVKFIDSDRVSVRGFGRSEPIASNENEEGRKQNRRIEILIIK